MATRRRQELSEWRRVTSRALYIGYISASPTACPSRRYGRASTQNDRLSKAVSLSTGTPIPAQRACRRRSRFGGDIETTRALRMLLRHIPNRRPSTCLHTRLCACLCACPHTHVHCVARHPHRVTVDIHIESASTSSHHPHLVSIHIQSTSTSDR